MMSTAGTASPGFRGLWRHVAVGTFTVVAAVSLVASIAVTPAFAQGDAVVEVLVDTIDTDDPGREWEIAIQGGVASTGHLTLEPIAAGFLGEFTVSVTGDEATVTLTAQIPNDWELSMVGCLDDLDPPTEIEPVLDSASFAFGVVPSRRYSCFAAIFPLGAPPEAPTDTTQPPDVHLPPTDTVRDPVVESQASLVCVVGIVAVLAGTVLVRRRASR